MGSRKIRRRTICILLWLIAMSGGILVKMNRTDDMWQLVYDGIYRQDEDIAAMGGLRLRSSGQDVYRYMDYWASEVEELCENGEAMYDTTEEADTTEAADTGQTDAQPEQVQEEQTGAAAQQATESVTAMADIRSSYLDMDADTLLSYCYNVPHPACVADGDVNAGELLGEDVSIDNSGGGYKVLIYHTHSSEAFADSRDGVVEDTIIGVGSRLAQELTDKYGIAVYHDTSAYDMMSGRLDREEAYVYSRAGVQKILEENPGIEVIIDLHRDGVADDVHLVTEVNGRQTARVMLVNGMSRDGDGVERDYLPNAYKKNNLALSLQLYLAGRGNYGDFMRKIYLGTTRYNLDLMPHAALIEVGAQTNTVEEEMNAVEPLARVIAKVLLD